MGDSLNFPVTTSVPILNLMVNDTWVVRDGESVGGAPQPPLTYGEVIEREMLLKMADLAEAVANKGRLYPCLLCGCRPDLWNCECDACQESRRAHYLLAAGFRYKATGEATLRDWFIFRHQRPVIAATLVD